MATKVQNELWKADVNDGKYYSSEMEALQAEVDFYKKISQRKSESKQSEDSWGRCAGPYDC